jgi:hypothetical protein
MPRDWVTILVIEPAADTATTRIRPGRRDVGNFTGVAVIAGAMGGRLPPARTSHRSAILSSRAIDIV